MAQEGLMTSYQPGGGPVIGQAAFRGIFWGGFILATLAIVLRFCLRYRSFRRFYLDDAFVLFAWVTTLVYTILLHITADTVYLYSKVSRGIVAAPPDFVERIAKSWHARWAMVILVCMALWGVKLAFLFFFRRLYAHIDSWMRYWWTVFTITLVMLPIIFGMLKWNCITGRLETMDMRCMSTSYVRPGVIIPCVFDVVTDILITCIPIALLWKIHIDLRRKLALGTVFCATVITLLLGIMRIVFLSSTEHLDTISWVTMMNTLEVFAALIVCSIGSFSSIFVSQISGQIKRPLPLLLLPNGQQHTIGSPPRPQFDVFRHTFITSAISSSAISQGEHGILDVESLFMNETPLKSSSCCHDGDSRN